MKTRQMQPGQWSELQTDQVYSGRYLNVWRNRVSDPLGALKTWEVVERSDSVIMIYLQGEKLKLVRVFRYPTNEPSWEFPCGGIDSGETPEEAAARELAEEAAVLNVSLTRIGAFYPVPALMKQRCFVFVASHRNSASFQEETSGAPAVAEYESASFTAVEIQGMITNGEITDGFTLCATAIFLAQQNHLM